MSKADTLLANGLGAAEAQAIELLLASQGIEALVEISASGMLDVRVAAEDEREARRILAEERAYGVSAAAIGEPDAHDPFGDRDIDAPPHWFGRGSSMIAAIAAVCVAVFALSVAGPDGPTRARLLELGAISHGHVEAGEHWRLLTAVFLHFGAPHLFSNMVTLVLVGPPLAHQLGSWRFLAVFVLTGVLGNATSHVLYPTLGLKAGASGGIAGVMGALGGQALRPKRRRGRFKAWQRLGALAAFYGLLVGFGPGRDNVAHLGGLVFGVIIGRMLDPLPPERGHGMRGGNGS